MKNAKVSVVIPVYKPEKEVFEKVKNSLKNQTVHSEIIEIWNMPEAKSKGEIVVILAQDCVPEDESWLEKLIKPLGRKEIVASVSALELTEEYWKKYYFLVRILTINDLKIRHPKMDIRACAYRKKDIIQTGFINEDPSIISIDGDFYSRLIKLGKIAYPSIKVFHLHQYKSSKKVIKNLYIYSQGNGKITRKYGIGFVSFWKRAFRAIPVLGIISLLYRFPMKNYYFYLPLFLPLAVIIHIINICGFWSGFLLPNRESIRNLEVLKNHQTFPKE